MINMISKLANKFNWTEKDVMYFGIVLSTLMFFVWCAVLYHILCALEYTGELIGIGRYIYLIVAVLGLGVHFNGEKYALIQNDTHRNVLGSVIVGCSLITYWFF